MTAAGTRVISQEVVRSGQIPFCKYRILDKERSRGQLQGVGFIFFLIFLSIIQKEHNLKIKTSPSPKDPGSLTLPSIHSLTHLHTYPSTLYLSIYPSTHLSITIDIDMLVNYFSSLMRNFLKTNVNKTTCNKQ